MLKGMIRAATLLVGLATAMTAMTAAGQNTKRITVPAGTRILIRTADSIDSSKQKAGYRFTASLETNLQADNVVVARRGTPVYGVLATASSAGKMKGSSELGLELTEIAINGTSYPLLTSTYEIQGKGEGVEYSEKGRRRRGTGRSDRWVSRRRKGSWDWSARRRRRRNGCRRYQERAAALDSQRIAARVPAGTAGGAARRKVAGAGWLSMTPESDP